jgi:eukaryotic-like serine/threonine-protein kinase
MADLEPGAHLDRFEITSVLAKGGMATLYRGRDTTSGHEVVLKVPHLEYAADLVFHERFRREEDIGRRLDHPGIVKVLSGDGKSRLYLAMEFVEGETLRERLRREHQLPVAEAIRIGIAIADALEYLHGHGVVHRDLKPENVMLVGDQVKLLDFGIALDTTQRRIEWAGLSQTVGTPDYMAPEQIQGRPGDARTDVYALGVILYEMLAGRVPFIEGVPRDRPPAALRAQRPDVPPAVDEIVRQALAVDPEARPQRALELRDALAFPSSVVARTAPTRAPIDALGRGTLLVAGLAALLVYALFLVLLAR